jgi:hypothetical protein
MSWICQRNVKSGNLKKNPKKLSMHQKGWTKETIKLFGYSYWNIIY